MIDWPNPFLKALKCNVKLGLLSFLTLFFNVKESLVYKAGPTQITLLIVGKKYCQWPYPDSVAVPCQPWVYCCLGWERWPAGGQIVRPKPSIFPPATKLCWLHWLTQGGRHFGPGTPSSPLPWSLLQHRPSCIQITASKNNFLDLRDHNSNAEPGFC